jgi:hypothetical protein
MSVFNHMKARKLAPAGLVLFALPGLGQNTPHLMATLDELNSAMERAAVKDWAKTAVTTVINNARSWPQSHLTKYGLKDLQLPPDGGQWSAWYVCPIHGVSLRYTPPNTNTCPIDGKKFTGWPYDQAVYTLRHNDLANASQYLALAYWWTGDSSFADAAAWILKQYASMYTSYPYHDRNNQNSIVGGRVLAETLDEAEWLIPITWAYDLLAGSPALNSNDRTSIENGLLRAAVATIRRYDAGKSNWQSWHNAAVGGVGFTLGDHSLSDWAIDGPSGF